MESGLCACRRKLSHGRSPSTRPDTNRRPDPQQKQADDLVDCVRPRSLDAPAPQSPQIASNAEYT